MRFFDKENPFSNYTKKGAYKQYLKDLKKIYVQLKKAMKKNATIIVEASNTIGKGHPMTPLAFDIARELSTILFFERVIVYCAKDGAHSYCLVFKNK